MAVGTSLQLGTRVEERQSVGSIHRFRDLDRRGRLIAAGFGTAILLAPLLALIRYWPDWFPTGDPALMGFRALDVGTTRTPLIGQPSLSGDYVDDTTVNHLGAIHFYLLAPFVRVLGVSFGMQLVSVLITGGCLLISAWALFRQLGPRAAAWGAVVLGVVSFTTGASSFVLPVSSSIAGYPFFCSMVLLWCILCGDLKLLPLTVAVVSFTALQHLSVLPALVVACVLTGVGAALAMWRGTWWTERPSKQALLRRGAVAGAIALPLWAPVLAQNFLGNHPNLTALWNFTRHADRPKLGYSIAVRHLTHVLGVPPLLGRRQLHGSWLFTKTQFLTQLSAVLVLAMLIFAGWYWRQSHPKRSALAVMGLITTLAGLVGSATVPEGHEQTRLVFYHWMWPLTAIVLLVAGLLISDLVARFRMVRPAWQPALVGIAALAIIIPAAVNPTLDRWTNSINAAYPPFPRQAMERLADEVAAQRDEFDGTVVLLGRKASSGGLDSALALQLEVRGLRVNLARGAYVDGERQTNRREVDQGLILLLDTNEPFEGHPTPPEEGELIAEQDVPGGVALWAHYDLDPHNKEPATLKVYLLERSELLRWATKRELK